MRTSPSTFVGGSYEKARRNGCFPSLPSSERNLKGLPRRAWQFSLTLGDMETGS